MKRITVVMLALAIVVPSLIGCASGGIPTKVTRDDCLILIKTTIKNPSSITMARKYYFIMSEGYPTIKASSSKSGYMAVAIRGTDAKITGLISYISASEPVIGDTIEYPLDIRLPYKPGSVVVADFPFCQEVFTKGEDNTRFFTRHFFRGPRKKSNPNCRIHFGKPKALPSGASDRSE